MIFDLETRLVVVGNSGSGKSTLAERVGIRLELPVHDLDFFHWLGSGLKRDEAEAKEIVTKVAAGSAWIIEGVYGWLAEGALSRATMLIWLDLNWAECREGLLGRGLRRGMIIDDQEELIAWAEAYWTRTTSSSFVGHERLFQRFNGPKLRLRTRAELSSVAIADARIIEP